MKITALVLSLGISLSFGYISPAAAEDFTFTVPVRLQGIPANVPEGLAGCLALATDGTVIAGGSTPYSIPADGNFSQDIVVKFNAASGRNPFDAKNWDCRLRLKIGGSFRDVTQSDTKPNTYRVLVLQGSLPQ